MEHNSKHQLYYPFVKTLDSVEKHNYSALPRNSTGYISTSIPKSLRFAEIYNTQPNDFTV